jgi:hypothetical protein
LAVHFIGQKVTFFVHFFSVNFAICSEGQFANAAAFASSNSSQIPFKFCQFGSNSSFIYLNPNKFKQNSMVESTENIYETVIPAASSGIPSEIATTTTSSTSSGCSANGKNNGKGRKSDLGMDGWH